MEKTTTLSSDNFEIEGRLFEGDKKNGADHFYGGYEGQLEAVLTDFLAN
jgi:hypothetical protein